MKMDLYIEDPAVTNSVKLGGEGESLLEIIPTVLFDGAVLLCGKEHMKSSVLPQVARNYGLLVRMYWVGDMG